MRRLLLPPVLLAMTLTGVPGAAAADRALPLLPPLPRSQVLEQSRLLSEHGPPVRPAPLYRSGFVVEASNGYKVGVSTFGSSVYLEVWRGGRVQRTMTAYLARGVAQPERLQATFGNFGKVSMRFRRSRNREVGRRCEFGRTLIKQRGVFVGSLRFKGEHDYISVRLHRAKGGIVRVGKRCRVRRRHSLPNLDFLFFKPKAALLALGRDGVDSTAFLALDAGKKSAFFTVAEEARGKLAIIHVAFVRRPGKVHTNEALTSGSLAPPAPFHGTGRYRAFPDGTHTWSGNLSVNFPGAPRFPLTGPNFETLLEVPF